MCQYLYVIGFDNNLVKVGWSTKPWERFTYHLKNARNYRGKSVQFENWYIEVLHAQMLEGLLLDWCYMVEDGHEMRSKEYFNLPFDFVVSKAKNLVRIYAPLVAA